MFPTQVRAAAAEATRIAYEGTTFSWRPPEPGQVRAHCISLAAYDLRHLGYKPRLSRGGRYSTALGARKALKRAGFDSIGAALADLGLQRVPWAYALAADIVELPSEEDWPALGVVLDPQHILAYSNIDGICRIARPNPSDILALWSAPPCLKPR